jgi:hypothetical protein
MFFSRGNVFVNQRRGYRLPKALTNFRSRILTLVFSPGYGSTMGRPRRGHSIANREFQAYLRHI